MSQALLFVCGIPGSGKTTFCRWLERTHGWVRIDTDAVYADPIVERDMYRLLSSLPVDVGRLVEQLRSRADNVVVEWGFQPLAYIDAIERLVGMGANLWWFDGDRDAAREAYSVREGGTLSALQAYDLQMARIATMWPRIAAAFDGHVVASVTSGPKHLAPAEIYQLLAPTIA